MYAIYKPWIEAASDPLFKLQFGILHQRESVDLNNMDAFPSIVIFSINSGILMRCYTCARCHFECYLWTHIGV